MTPAVRILVVRRRYVGDIVLLESVFRMLRRHWPAARIVACVDPAYRDLPRLHPAIDDTLPMPVRVTDWPGFLWRLRREKFTHVLDFDNRPRTALIALASGAGLRATLRHGLSVRAPLCYNHKLVVEGAYLDDHHITDFYLRLLRSLGIAIKDEPGHLVPLPHEVAQIEKLPEIAALPGDRPRLLVHPGSRSPHRIWPAESFATVCDTLQSEGRASVIFVAGPAEQPVVDAITTKMTTPAVVLKNAFSLTQLAALFASVDRLLCHDSGPMHLAAAVGTPVIALYGSQKISTWRPVGEDHLLLQAPLPCRDCVSPDFCKPNDSYFNHCVQKIPPDVVISALRSQFPLAGD
ncbi:MAG: glycosyltransferase family 9 protein [Nibricoccus sp.]